MYRLDTIRPRRWEKQWFVVKSLRVVTDHHTTQGSLVQTVSYMDKGLSSGEAKGKVVEVVGKVSS